MLFYFGANPHQIQILDPFIYSKTTKKKNFFRVDLIGIQISQTKKKKYFVI